MSTRSMNDHALWHTFEAPGTVALYDGGYMRSYAFRGLDLASASKADRVRANERLSDVLRTKGERWVWHIEGRNRRVSTYERGQFPNAAARLLDAERAATFQPSGSQFRMDHFITFTQSAPASMPVLLAEALTTGHTEAARTRQRDDFRRECDHIVRQMRGVVHVDEMDDDEVATYLHSTVSTRWHPVRARDHEILSESLGDERFVRGLGLSRLGNNYIAFLTLGGFPDHSTPHMLSALSRRPYELRWVTRWNGMSRGAAKAMMERREEKALGSVAYLKDMFVSKLFEKSEKISSVAPPRKNREALKHAEGAARQMERLSERGFGFMTTTFVVWDRDARRCQENRSDLKACLQEVGLTVRDEHVEPTKIWRMSIPGNREMGRRTYPVSSRACVDIGAWDAIWTGREFDAQLFKRTGVRRSWLQTADPVPFRINTDLPGGGGHAVLFGRTGQAAKSTLANHLALQFFGWPDARVISVSVGRSELGPVLLSGGAVYKLGDTSSPLTLQPLARIDTPDGAIESAEWLQLCLEVQGITATPEHRQALADALLLMGHDKPERRTMTALVADLSSRHPPLAEALRPYTRAGHYGHIFDGDSAADLSWKQWTMFDIAKLLDMRPEAQTPAIALLMSLVRQQVDGRPLLVCMDECPQYLSSERLQAGLKRILDTDRKNNVRALLVAQTPGQLLQHTDLLASIKSGCGTAIFGPEAKALQLGSDYAHFDIGEAELTAIAKLPLGSYMLRNQFGTRVFALEPGDIALTLTGMSSPEELALLERLHAESDGDADKMLDALLNARGLAEKAGKLSQWKTDNGAKTAA